MTLRLRHSLFHETAIFNPPSVKVLFRFWWTFKQILFMFPLMLRYFLVFSIIWKCLMKHWNIWILFCGWDLSLKTARFSTALGLDFLNTYSRQHYAVYMEMKLTARLFTLLSKLVVTTEFSLFVAPASKAFLSFLCWSILVLWPCMPNFGIGFFLKLINVIGRADRTENKHFISSWSLL